MIRSIASLPLASLLLVSSLLGACGGARPTPASAQSGAPACPATPTIDDFEDGDGQVVLADGRSGYWYTYADDAGSTIEPSNDAMKPVVGGANGTKKALRFTGKLAKQGIVFAGAGVGFVDPKAAYDASCCQGVRFSAKAKGCRGLVRLQAGDANTVPEGGKCERCFDHFGKTYKLTEQWETHELPFAEMSQEGWGEQQDAIDAAHLFELAFAVKDFDCEYEVWVDELEFIGCAN